MTRIMHTRPQTEAQIKGISDGTCLLSKVPSTLKPPELPDFKRARKIQLASAGPSDKDAASQLGDCNNSTPCGETATHFPDFQTVYSALTVSVPLEIALTLFCG